MSYKTEFPSIFNAGDSIQFTSKAYDLEGTQLTYADGFTGYVILTNETSKYSASTTTDVTEGFLFSITSSETSGWTVGNYSVAVFADDGTDRYLITKKQTEVKPDLFSVDSADTRSEARKIRDALHAAILGLATNNQLSMSIAGRSIQRMSLDELINAKLAYDNFVSQEENKQGIIDGKPSKNTIRLRWGR